MGTASLSLTQNVPISLGNKKLQFGTVTLSNSYATNGDTLVFTTASGFTQVDQVIAGCTAGGYVVYADLSNNKVKVFEAGADGGALDEVANATNLSAQTFEVLIFGI